MKNKLEVDALLGYYINEYLILEAKIDKEIDQINEKILEYNKENGKNIPLVFERNSINFGEL